MSPQTTNDGQAEQGGAMALGRTVTVVTALGGAAVLAFWLWHDPARKLVERVPGMDGRPPRNASAQSEEPTRIGENFTRFAPQPPVTPGSWPRFRGARFDNICHDTAALANAWDPAGPRELWRVDLGEGHAGPAVDRGRVYVLDYDEKKAEDALRCFGLADGKEIWRRSYHVHVKRNHGMSRAVPAVAEGFVVTIGPRCHTMCVEAETGDFLWGKDLVAEYGAKTPLWYTAQCPLIDEGVAVLAPCGTNILMLGVDCATGETVWQTPNPDGLRMTHSSIVPMTLVGVRQYVYAAVGGIVGISAEAQSRGKLLWQCTDFDPKVIAPSPVPVGNDRVFLTAGYGGGCILMQVTREGDAFGVKTVYRHGPDDGLASEQQTPIFFDGHLFAILPKDAGTLRKQFVCYHPDNGIAWTSGKTDRFGLGPFILADGKFYVLSDEGVLHMLEATVSGYKHLAEARILEGPDAWGPMACVGGLLLARDSHEMACLDLR